MRAGIQSMDPGQDEAARSLGLTSTQSMRHIILPQGFQKDVTDIYKPSDH